jgi:hypothetical protein
MWLPFSSSDCQVRWQLVNTDADGATSVVGDIIIVQKSGGNILESGLFLRESIFNYS